MFAAEYRKRRLGPCLLGRFLNRSKLLGISAVRLEIADVVAGIAGCLQDGFDVHLTG